MERCQKWKREGKKKRYKGGRKHEGRWTRGVQFGMEAWENLMDQGSTVWYGGLGKLPVEEM